MLRLVVPLLCAFDVASAFHRVSRVQAPQVRDNGSSPLPVVLWHGLGDTCCNPLSMGGVKRLVERQLPGVKVFSIEVGGSITADFSSGFISNLNDQVNQTCQYLRQQPELTNGYNGMGFSQGGLFLRALTQRCPSPPIRSLVSIGGPQQGVFGFPHCTGSGFLCETVRRALDRGAYEGEVQRHVVPAQYWHDPLQPQVYREKSDFLADINQENSINEEYKSRISALESLVLVKFLQDTMVIPPESEWFGFFVDGQDKEVQPLRNSTLYQEDKLGLRKLDSEGKLHFISVDADHLRISETQLEQIVDTYFK